MTNRDFLKQVSDERIPDAADFLAGARKSKRSWRKIAVSLVAAASIGAVVTVGAQPTMNQIEQFEHDSGAKVFKDITQLETGHLYTIEKHMEYIEFAPPGQLPTYSYTVYNELPDGTDINKVPAASFMGDYSDGDESREMCFTCRCVVWTVTDPVEYSYQRPSATEPETFRVRMLECARCGRVSEKFDADGKVIPHGLLLEINQALSEEEQNEVALPLPHYDGVEIYSELSELQEGVRYNAFMLGGRILFYESSPENRATVGHGGFVCMNCEAEAQEYLGPCDLLLGGIDSHIYVDEYYGDEYLIVKEVMVCATCGEIVLSFLPEDE